MFHHGFDEFEHNVEVGLEPGIDRMTSETGREMLKTPFN
jgi:hypothetical protein